VRLNEIAALSFAEGAEVALEALAELEDVDLLDSYQPYHAARADLLRRAGRTEESAAAYRRAIELTDNATERAFLENRLEALS
jgi:RNA polymerase sigma-70 factor (ECF subfamily)